MIKKERKSRKLYEEEVEMTLLDEEKKRVQMFKRGWMMKKRGRMTKKEKMMKKKERMIKKR